MQFARAKMLRPLWWKRYKTRTVQSLPVYFNARTQKSESNPVVFLLVKFLNCVLTNSGLKISLSNNYFCDSPNTEGLFMITVTQQWSFRCCCHRALIKIQANYLSFSPSTGKPLNNKEKHEQEEGSIPNTLVCSPLPGNDSLASVFLACEFFAAFISIQWIVSHCVMWKYTDRNEKISFKIIIKWNILELIEQIILGSDLKILMELLISNLRFLHGSWAFPTGDKRR